MKKLTLFAIIFALLLSVIPVSASANSNNRTTTPRELTPILFLHGWNGTMNTFNNMIDKLAIDELNLFRTEKNVFNFNYEILGNKTAPRSFGDSSRFQLNNRVWNTRNFFEVDKNSLKNYFDRVNKNERYIIKHDMPNAQDIRILNVNGQSNRSFVLSQIIYNDTDTYVQTLYIKRTLERISQISNSRIKEVFIVGHSMGGLGAWRFTVDCNKNELYEIGSNGTCAF